MFKILQEGANRILLNKSGNMSAVGINRRQPCFTHGTVVTEKRQEIYPNTMESREENRDVISPMFKFSADVRKVIYTTNVIESINSVQRWLNRQECALPAKMDTKKLQKTK